MNYKEKIKNFMNRPYYLMIVLGMFFFVWSFKFLIPQSFLLQTTLIAYIPLAILLSSILIYCEDTVYTFVFLMGFIFSIGDSQINLDTLDELKYAAIAFAIVLIGMIIHLIKYQIKFKMTLLLISFLLVMISFYIPMLYQPFSIEALFISSLGLLYLLFILFYSVTLKKAHLEYLMRIMLFTLLFLSLELMILIISSLASFEGDLISRYQQMLARGFSVGWGNVNDLTILMVLFSSSLLYYLIKYPKNVFPMLGMGLTLLLIMLSFSRGSMITISLYGVVVFTYVLYAKNKYLYRNLVISLVLACLIIITNRLFFENFLRLVANNLDYSPEKMLTGRLTLWQHALQTFKAYPWFGYGWYTEPNILIPQENRITIYHSTFFHILATGGIFGLLVLGFHFYVVYRIFKKIKNKTIQYSILLTYILTGLHGLIDNTQYMICYTFSTMMIFLFFDAQPREINQKTYGANEKLDVKNFER